MGKAKKSKRVKNPTTVPAADGGTSRSFNSFFDHRITYIFVISLAFLFLYFIWELSQNPDFEITLLQPFKWFKPFQYILFSLLTIGFGYFGWRFLQGAQDKNQYDHIVFIGVSVLILVVYVSTFTKEISLNGDNGEYLIITKSLVERGKVLRLETPTETPNSLASVGLPILLTPIYKLWGFDFVKMKALILLMGYSVFFLLYHLFNRKLGFALATMLAMVGVTSPYIVHNARDIMTETPFFFWSVVSLILITRYHESKHFNWKYYGLLFGAIIMTYLTRAVGIGLIAALILFLFSQISWSKLYKSETRTQVFNSLEFRKFFMIVIPFVIGGIIWQILQHQSGVSQAIILFNSNLAYQIEYNTNSAMTVIPQMLFRPETYRFQNFYNGATLVSLNLPYYIALLLLLIGLFNGLKSRNILAGFTVMTSLVIITASLTPKEMVIIRYLSILMPFLIYFMFTGTDILVQYILRRTKIGNKARWVHKIIPLLVLSEIFFINMHGHSVNMTMSTVGNDPAYHDFMDVANWAKNNLPDDAYVVSVKPRLFYVLSGKKGTRLSTIEEEYSKDYEVEKLALFQKLGITHVVLDGVSGATRENIFPIVQNHPDMFQTLYIGAMSGTSSINKIIYKN